MCWCEDTRRTKSRIKFSSSSFPLLQIIFRPTMGVTAFDALMDLPIENLDRMLSKCRPIFFRTLENYNKLALQM